jgi:hypothetical protein
VKLTMIRALTVAGLLAVTASAHATDLIGFILSKI